MYDAAIALEIVSNLSAMVTIQSGDNDLKIELNSIIARPVVFAGVVISSPSTKLYSL